MKFRCTVVLGSVLVLGLLGSAWGDVLTWIGTGSGHTGNWNTASYWSGVTPARVPTTGDTAIISQGTPSINATLSPAPDLIQISPGVRVQFTAANSNNFEVNGGILDTNGAYTVSGAILLTDNSTIRNNLSVNGYSFTFSGPISEDSTPRVLTFDGKTNQVTTVSGSNNYTGGTIVASQVTVASARGLGTGPVTVNSGANMSLTYGGDYQMGLVTANNATIKIQASNKTVKSLALNMTGGTLMYQTGGNSSTCMDTSDSVTINGTVSIRVTSGYYNAPFLIGASIGGTGKAVLDSGGTGTYCHMDFGSLQAWSGGTDVKNTVFLDSAATAAAWGSATGGVLPAGTVTVYPMGHPSGTNALLNLNNTTPSLNGGLDPNTDLVLMYDGTTFATISLTTNIIVHSLTLNGTVIPAGTYTGADFPDYIKNSGSYTIRVMTPDDGPLAITDLAGTCPDWFKVALTWTAPSDKIDGNASSYDIRYSTSEITDDTWSSATPVTPAPAPLAAGQQQTVTVSGLHADTDYYFAVKAADSGLNWSSLSNVLLIHTPAAETNPPAAAADLSVARIGPNRVTLTWTATADNGNDAGSGAASVYDIRYSTDPINSDTDFAAAAQVTGLSSPQAPGATEVVAVSGLNPSMTYYFALKIGDEVPNWSAFSTVTAQTDPADVDAPLAVSDLASRGAGIRDVTLGWTAPADQGTAGTDSYDLRCSTTPINGDADFTAAASVSGLPVPGAPGDFEQFTITGLNPGTTYYFAVKTTDAAVPANTSAMSNVISVSTLPPVTPVTVHNPWLVNDRVADTHNINTMGVTYGNAYTPDGVIPPATEEQKAINIYNNQKRRMYHWADEPPSIGGFNNRDPSYNQNVFGWGLCGNHATEALTIARAAGFAHARFCTVNSGKSDAHNIYEVQYGGLWHLFDTMTTMYCFTKTTPPHVASLAEIAADQTILLNAVADGRACPGFLLCGDSPTWYATSSTTAKYDESVTQAANWTGNMDLRLGQTFKRTWESWLAEHPTPRTDADGMKGIKDPPFHHEATKDYRDYVNLPYWEPYALNSTQNAALNMGIATTYRRWANGTDTLAPDFRSAGYQALLDPTSHDIATYYQDSISPDLHAAAAGTVGEAVFKINVPYYITDASFSGDFVKATGGDFCKILVSSDGSTWTTVYTAPLGTTHVSNQDIGTNVFGKWSTWYIKVQITPSSGISGAGVSNFVVTTVFEHNKGAMAYLDKGVNHVTLTFDNPDELAASGNVVHITYKWKEYDGQDWTIDKRFDAMTATSPATFTIATGGTKVPRTEYIAMEITQPDDVPPSPIDNVTAPAGGVGPRSVTLQWTATGDDGSVGRASYYDIRYSTSPITDMASFNAATPATVTIMPQTAGSPETFAVSGLSPSTTYNLAVVAYDKGGNASGVVSGSVASATTLADPPPATVTDLAAPAAGIAKSSIQLTWTATGEDGNTGTAARYDLRYSTSPISTMGDFNSATPFTGVPAPKPAGQAESFAVGGLAAATTYNFGLIVYDAANQPSGLATVSARTSDDLPPAAVTDLALVTSQKTSVQVIWTATGEDGTTGTAARYDLRYSTDTISTMDDFNNATVVAGLSAPQAAGSPETFTITGLSAATTYNIALVVYDAANQASGLSNVLSVRTPDDVAPGAVSDLAAVGTPQKDSQQLTWTATGEDGNIGTAARYDLRYSTSNIATIDDFNNATQVSGLPAPQAAGSAESFTVTGLSASTTYYYALVVYDGANQPSGLSNIAMAMTRKTGDIDGDGQVNLADLKLLIAAWNSEGGGAYANWNPDADLDGDNYVNLSDLKILIAHWNT